MLADLPVGTVRDNSGGSTCRALVITERRWPLATGGLGGAAERESAQTQEPILERAPPAGTPHTLPARAALSHFRGPAGSLSFSSPA